MKYKRILLKLSGQSLEGEKDYGIDENKLMDYAEQVKELAQQGVEVGIVIGGGNIFRGLAGEKRGFDRVKGDYMGMLATVINSIALHSAFESIGQPSRLFTSIRMEPIGEYYSPLYVKQAFKAGEVVIIGGGTSNPFFTTDSASALRAVEMDADILLKGTRVDGIYTADPEKDSSATKFKHISFDEVIDKELKVMDLTAFALCKDNKMPIYVFDMDTEGNLLKVVKGEEIGTIVE
ncbi:MAG: UMP kinase [Bacteroidales bacterium]|nr:UMP kinase [Bacteroidales bacterium]